MNSIMFKLLNLTGIPEAHVTLWAKHCPIYPRRGMTAVSVTQESYQANPALCGSVKGKDWDGSCCDCGFICQEQVCRGFCAAWWQ